MDKDREVQGVERQGYAYHWTRRWGNCIKLEEEGLLLTDKQGSGVFGLQANRQAGVANLDRNNLCRGAGLRSYISAAGGGSYSGHFPHTLSTSTLGPEQDSAIPLSLSPGVVALEGRALFCSRRSAAVVLDRAVPMLTAHIHSELHSLGVSFAPHKVKPAPDVPSRSQQRKYAFDLVCIFLCPARALLRKAYKM